MEEEPFSVEVDGGELRGHRGGSGPPALVLHGGPALPDYMDGCAAELGGIFTTIRYTQRGTPPSGGSPPYTIEAHLADAVAVLDTLGVERAWAVGHSWGAHLALHLLAAWPERLLGAICIGALGASSDVFPEFDRNLRRGMTPAQIARVDEVERLRRDGRASEAELLERFRILWPHYFADPARAAPNPVERIGAGPSTQTNASIAEHFARGTLAASLPAVRARVLFLHGSRDPLPPRTAHETAALIPGAEVVILDGLGHFPWLERPGALEEPVRRFVEN